MRKQYELLRRSPSPHRKLLLPLSRRLLQNRSPRRLRRFPRQTQQRRWRPQPRQPVRRPRCRQHARLSSVRIAALKRGARSHGQQLPLSRLRLKFQSLQRQRRWRQWKQNRRLQQRRSRRRLPLAKLLQLKKNKKRKMRVLAPAWTLQCRRWRQRLRSQRQKLRHMHRWPQKTSAPPLRSLSPRQMPSMPPSRRLLQKLPRRHPRRFQTSTLLPSHHLPARPSQRPQHARSSSVSIGASR